MNDKMRTGMAEATRLTRAGQLIEATAVIQRTLWGSIAPEMATTAGDHTTAEPIDATWQVVDEPPLSTTGATQEPDQRTRPSAAALLSPPDAAVSPQARGNASAAPTADQADRVKYSEASTIKSTYRKQDEELTTPRRPVRLRPTLRLRRREFGGKAPIARPDLASSEILAGGQFIAKSYSNAAGTRSYQLYIPSGYRGQILPLVVMLHGCTQTPEDFAAGTRMNRLAEKEQFFVAYPAQTVPANQSKCWNWFQTTDQHRDRGEPSIIAGITRQLTSTYHIDVRRVYLAGLSAGGAMAAIMGMNYPDLYAAVGVHSGLAYGAAHDLPSAFAAMQHGGKSPLRQQHHHPRAVKTPTRLVPTIVFHGDRDTTVHPNNGDQVLAQWATLHAGHENARAAKTKLHVTLQRGQIPDGHTYTRSVYREANGRAVMERWLVHDAGHGWSGGSPYGSFTNPKGPDASQEMVRFFYQHLRSES
jgi:poly(hydroxyalkanoate) depolymerase family esterase